MSAGRELMRVSDTERQAAADRLRAAMGEGRLDLLEYDTRIAAAYSAVTYADLDTLFVDLPAHGADLPAHGADLPAHGAPPSVAPAPQPAVAARPVALKVLWIIWTGVVLINLTVWLLVSLGNGELDYFWPMWLAVPGVVLGGVTAVVEAARSQR